MAIQQQLECRLTSSRSFNLYSCPDRLLSFPSIDWSSQNCIFDGRMRKHHVNDCQRCCSSNTQYCHGQTGDRLESFRPKSNSSHRHMKHSATWSITGKLLPKIKKNKNVFVVITKTWKYGEKKMFMEISDIPQRRSFARRRSFSP